MLLESARAYAERELERLSPYIVRGEIAGSIRRGEKIVKDIELVVIPTPDLFGVLNLQEGIYPSRRLIKNGDKYKQVDLGLIKLDLFIVTPPADWGVIFTIRTGPWEFSRWIVTPRSQGGALPSYARVKDGAVIVRDTGERIPMPEEKDFLEFLGLEEIGLRRYPNIITPLSSVREANG